MRRRKGEELGPDYAESRRSPERGRPARRILLIEQSRVDRLLVSAALMLKGQGETRLTEVVDFDLGLSLLLQRSYDLVLLDDALPGQSSWETTRAIRGVAPTTPIVRHGQYLERRDNDNGLDKLVEAVEAALSAAGVAAAVGATVLQSFVSEPWLAASVVW
jgi:CheY-like chemotaxis protein